MKIPFLNIWITRVDWKAECDLSGEIIADLEKETAEQFKIIYDYKKEQSETYTDKQGRLRFKHNGQFAPDKRKAA